MGSAHSKSMMAWPLTFLDCLKLITFSLRERQANMITVLPGKSYCLQCPSDGAFKGDIELVLHHSCPKRRLLRNEITEKILADASSHEGRKKFFLLDTEVQKNCSML